MLSCAGILFDAYVSTIFSKRGIPEVFHRGAVEYAENLTVFKATTWYCFCCYPLTGYAHFALL